MQENEVGVEELDETKQKILDYVLKNSPYGETNEVIKDLRKLVSDFGLYEQYVNELLVKHAQEHFAICKGNPSFSDFLLTPVNYLDGYYLDQSNAKKVYVDHESLTISRVEDIQIETNPTLSQYRTFIQKGISDYIRNYYSGTQSGSLGIL